MDGVRKHLLRKSQPEHLVFIGEERETGEFYPKMVSKPHPSSLHFSDVTPCTVEPRLTLSAPMTPYGVMAKHGPFSVFSFVLAA